MKNIEAIDPNVKANPAIREGIRYHNVRTQPFCIHGLYQPETEGVFRRIPLETATSVSEGVTMIHTAPSGGRIRFRTDSQTISLKATFASSCIMSIMALTGSCSFDIYADGEFIISIIPEATNIHKNARSFDFSKGIEKSCTFKEKKMRDILIHFPLYSEVDNVWIGLEENAQLLPAKDYQHTLPVIFYGSSITMGGCAARPGNTYPAILSRWLDTEFINLGFAGNALGEPQMAEYIANLPMSVFVYDYDFNTPNAEHLNKTHDAMYQIIRKKNPDLPIIIMTRPNVPAEKDERARIIY
ncbi:MAG: hypothetical protein E7399_08835 [Ruminococcaceae bacterium]|nr:hypothetical protein [Oscillospiraceae bacterium]